MDYSHFTISYEVKRSTVITTNNYVIKHSSNCHLMCVIITSNSEACRATIICNLFQTFIVECNIYCYDLNDIKLDVSKKLRRSLMRLVGAFLSDY